jgi:uncharacterized coiled-coil protein SlyX
MTDASGLGEAILLRLGDRLAELEQHGASSGEAIKAISENVAELRTSLSALRREFDDLRARSTAARTAFEEMRIPLQHLLDMRAKFSGGWLVITALFIVVSYLFHPLLGEFYRWRLGGK